MAVFYEVTSESGESASDVDTQTESPKGDIKYEQPSGATVQTALQEEDARNSWPIEVLTEGTEEATQGPPLDVAIATVKAEVVRQDAEESSETDGSEAAQETSGQAEATEDESEEGAETESGGNSGGDGPHDTTAQAGDEEEGSGGDSERSDAERHQMYVSEVDAINIALKDGAARDEIAGHAPSLGGRFKTSDGNVVEMQQAFLLDGKTPEEVFENLAAPLRSGQGVEGLTQLVDTVGPTEEHQGALILEEVSGDFYYYIHPEDRDQIPVAHFEKLMGTLQGMAERGLTLGISIDNVIYDPGKGFTINGYSLAASPDAEVSAEDLVCQFAENILSKHYWQENESIPGDAARFLEAYQKHFDTTEVPHDLRQTAELWLQKLWEEQPEELQAMDVVVERRQIGNVEVRGVCCAHVIENAKVIADGLAGSDLIAVELNPIKDEADRQRVAADLSSVTTGSDPHPPEIHRRSYAHNAVAQDNGFNAILHNLVDTGPTVALIDATEEQLSHFNDKELEAVMGAYDTTVEQLAPLADARSAGMRLCKDYQAYYASREAVMSQQLEALIAQAAQKGEPTVIGVILGKDHFPVITQLGEPVDAQESVENMRMLTKYATPVYSMKGAVEADDAAEAANQVDHLLLADYLVNVLSPQKATTPLKRVMERNVNSRVRIRMGELDDAQIAEYMTRLEVDLADDASQEIKAERVKASLGPLLDSIGA